MKKTLFKTTLFSFLFFGAFLLMTTTAEAEGGSKKPVKCKNYDADGNHTGNGNTCPSGSGLCIEGNECSGKPSITHA